MLTVSRALPAVLLLALLCPRLAAADIVSMPLYAQTGVPEGITVSGHAELKSKPDVAYLTVSVTTQSRDQEKAAQDNATRTTALLDALRKAGVADKDIQTQSYTLEPQYDYNANPPVLTGFQAVNTVQITIHDLTKAGLLIDKSISAGATQAGDLSFDLLDRKGLERQALADAVRDAAAKAGAMTDAAGMGLGRLLSLTESGTSSPPPSPRPMMMRAMAAEAAPPTPISPQQITVTADVTAVYALASK